MTIPLGRSSPSASRDQPGQRRGNALVRDLVDPDRPPLFGLAPGGVYRAIAVTGDAVRSYRTLSPLPGGRRRRPGGLLSVALSLGSPPPGVTRHRVSVEPGLSSNAPLPAPPRSSSRLALGQVETRGGGVNWDALYNIRHTRGRRRRSPGVHSRRAPMYPSAKAPLRPRELSHERTNESHRRRGFRQFRQRRRLSPFTESSAA